MSKKNDTELAETAPSETTAVALPEDMAQRFADNAGEGREDFGGGDFAIPFMAVLQKLSPQVDETDGKYVAGAKAGMIYNTVTGAIYPALTGVGIKDDPAGIKVVPAAYVKLFVEWVPRDQGGGFVAQHLPDSPAHRSATPDPDKPNKLVLPNGNMLVETAYYYVVVITESGPEWAVIAMSSTGLKLSRKWNNLIAAKTIKIGGEDKKVPIFGQVYQLNTGTEKNDFGSWYGWTVKGAGVVQDAELFDAAKTYRDAVRGGKVRATAPPVDGDEAGSSGTTAGGQNKDVPF